MNPTPPIRLQTFLSHCGVCSRRKAMTLIQEGHVSVNGRVVQEPSTPINPDKDKVCVNGKPIKEKRYEYLILNKPKGYVTTKADRFAEKTVLDLLPSNFKHLHPVGRLDKDTEGLLLLTNDGDLTHKLTHPRHQVDKTYLVCIHAHLTPENKKQLECGVVIEKRKTAPAKIKNIKTFKNRTEFLMTIHEGRKRQIRLMLQRVGHHVSYLRRIQQGPLVLGALKIGCFRKLTNKETAQIKK